MSKASKRAVAKLTDRNLSLAQQLAVARAEAAVREAAASPPPAPAPAPAPKPPTLRERRAEIERIEHPTQRAARALLFGLENEAAILTGGYDAPSSGQ